MAKKTICAVVASRANYARVKYVLKALNEYENVDLKIIVGASTLLDRFGKCVDVIKADGFDISRKIYYVVEGETLTTQAKSTGLGIVELSTAFEDLKPDMVITVADRFETMATAIAASFMNIPLAHIQGGEITGNIDETVRHSITKLSYLHFPCTNESKERILKMGEDSSRVFNFGCPAMDILSHENLSISNISKPYKGVGSFIDFSKPYILMVQHPVTTSFGQGRFQVEQTLNALYEFQDIQKIILWPNIDAGTDEVSKGIRVFRETKNMSNFMFYKNFTPEDYARILNHAVCVVGNSSSFIREGSYLGVPAVLVGDRQEGRECGANVVFSDYDKEEIFNKIQTQIEHGRYEKEYIFGKGDAGVKIANVLACNSGSCVKRMTY